MNTEAIRELATTHGPFASVYLPSDVGGPAWPVLRGHSRSDNPRASYWKYSTTP